MPNRSRLAHLVTSHVLSHIVQCLYYPQSKLLSLLVLCNRDILNMTDQAQIVDATDESAYQPLLIMESVSPHLCQLTATS